MNIEFDSEDFRLNLQFESDKMIHFVDIIRKNSRIFATTINTLSLILAIVGIWIGTVYGIVSIGFTAVITAALFIGTHRIVRIDDNNAIYSSKYIKELERKHNVIQPFNKEQLELAGYNLRIGRILTYDESINKMVANNELSIPPGGHVLIESLERIDLPGFIYADIGIGPGIQRKDIILIQKRLDPEYSGCVHIELINTSSDKVNINREDEFITLAFQSIPGVYNPDRDKFSSDSRLEINEILENDEKNDKIPENDQL